MHLCVSKCPTEPLVLPSDVKRFAEETGSRLCAYDVEVEDYDDITLYSRDGPCPVLPVLQRFVYILSLEHIIHILCMITMYAKFCMLITPYLKLFT